MEKSSFSRDAREVESVTLPTLTRRQADTIIAALRFWSDALQSCDLAVERDAQGGVKFRYDSGRPDPDEVITWIEDAALAAAAGGYQPLDGIETDALATVLRDLTPSRISA